MGVVKVLAVLMGVLIIIGSTVVVVTIIKRTSTTVAESPDAGAAVVLDEPAGTRIGGIAAVSNRLAVLLQGAGPDRIVLVDPITGKAAGSVALAR
jgi:hypothetical protein